MALPVITLISPEDNNTTYNSGITFTAQYDDSDLQNSTQFLFEIDVTATFNSLRVQTQNFSAVASGTQKTFIPTTALVKGYYYWRVTVTNSSGTTVSAVRKIYVEGAIKRTLYHYENIKKLDVFASKRAFYQYENIGKLNIFLGKRTLYNYENVGKLNNFTNTRALYDYENITADPPFPYIERLSSYRVNNGGSITIYGNGFGGKADADTDNEDRTLRGYGGEVFIGSMKCGIVSWNWQEITITVPSDAVSGALKVVLTKPDTLGTRTSKLIGIEVIIPKIDGSTGLELFVCDKNNPNQIIAELQSARDKTFQELLNGSGAGSFTISKQDKKGSDKSLITNDNYILCRIDGTDYFKWVIENIEPYDIGDGDRSSEKIQVSGRGVLSLLERTIVYPIGMPNPTSLERVFSGTTCASILITFLEEAKARGCLKDITWDFTSDADSLGNHWTDSLPISFHSGTNLLQVVEKFTSGMGIFDISISASLKLSAFSITSNTTGKGTDVSNKIIFRSAQGLLSHKSFYKSPELINTVLVEGEDGSIIEATNSESMNDNGRREGYLQSRNTPFTGLSDYGQMMLKNKSIIDWGVEAEVDWSYFRVNKDFFIGDWIKIYIPSYDYSEEINNVLRVKGYTVQSSNDTSALNISLNLNNIILEKVIKIDQMQERLSLNSADARLTSTQTAPTVTRETFTAHSHAHNSLSGLNNDDHIQYLTSDRHANLSHDFITKVSSIKAQGQNDITGAVTLIQGNNVTLTQDNANKTIKIDAAGGSGGATVNKQWMKTYGLGTLYANSTAYLTKGFVLEPVADIKMYGIGMIQSESSSSTIVLGIYEVNGTAQVGAALYRSENISGDGSYSLVSKAFTSPVTLLAGHRYVIASSNTTTGATYSFAATTSPTAPNEREIWGLKGGYYARINNANPGDGSTWEVTAGSIFHGAALIQI